MSEPVIVLAFSGGLDTSYALVLLREQGWNVLTAHIDTGGGHSTAREAVADRARELGAARHISVDAREELYSRIISYAIKANYLRNGGYPSCVGAERLVQAEKVVGVALANNADAVGHGSTGAGADHVRYDAVIRALAPHMEIITPIRDQRLTREEESAFLRARGYEVSAKTAAYSINESLIGTTIGGVQTYGSWDYLPEAAWTCTRSIDDAPAKGVGGDRVRPRRGRLLPDAARRANSRHRPRDTELLHTRCAQRSRRRAWRRARRSHGIYHGRQPRAGGVRSAGHAHPHRGASRA